METTLDNNFGLDILKKAIKDAGFNGKSLAAANKEAKETHTSLSPQTCYDILNGRLDPRWNQLQEICRIVNFPMKNVLSKQIPRAEIVLYWDMKFNGYQPRNYEQPPEALYFTELSDMNPAMRACIHPKSDNSLYNAFQKANKEIPDSANVTNYNLFDTRSGELCKSKETISHILFKRVLLQCTDFKTYYGRVLEITNFEEQKCKFQWIKSYCMDKDGAIVEDYEVRECTYRKIYQLVIENLVPIGHEVKREFI